VRAQASSLVNLAVIGCGYWGPKHVRVFSELPESNLLAVADSNTKHLAQVEKSVPRLVCIPNYLGVLRDERVSAIVVATPTSTHFPIVRDALAAGKHVLCEKPLCQSSADAAALVALAARRRRVLMVGHTFLFDPGIVALKELLKTGQTGGIRYLSADRTNLGPIRTDVNAAADLATHDIVIFNFLLDSEPQLVSASGACFLRKGIEDVVSIVLRYPGHILATLHASWLHPHKTRRIAVVGTRRMATWDGLEQENPLVLYDKGARAEVDGKARTLPASGPMWDREITRPPIVPAEPLKLQAAHFLTRIRKREFAGLSDGRFALGVVRVLEAIGDSIKANGSPVTVR
jgi:predicted dehydrogenase